MNDDESLQKELVDLLFSRPSLFREFYDSRREEGKQYTLLILGYIQSKGSDKVPLRDIKKKLVIDGDIHDTTLHRLLKELVDEGILEKSEDVELYQRSNPGKQKKNSFYTISKNAFRRLPETNKNHLIAKRYCQLDIAKEIIRECGLNADIEIEKRYNQRYGVQVEEDDED